MVYNVFKAKYFQLVDFLDTNLGYTPSFVWHSIHASRVVVRQGIKWKIDNGQPINVWKNPWLKHFDIPFIFSPSPIDFEHLNVCDIIDSSSHSWICNL